ncbi:hypothetical protein [Winogradskyella sp. 3972H.M.0a.05]|uniref:hypothetical protein n=1 Tax=Winogradskyella sp. 3972H.M.0a.05 TaxID=2950277 RepID=UPI003394E8D6
MQRLLYCIVFIFTLTTYANDKVDSYIGFPTAEVVNDYTTRIPFKLIDHLIVVEAELFDKKGNFIIDTGSETLILNSVHFKKSSNEKITHGVNADIHSSVKHVNTFLLKNFELRHTKSDVIDLSHIEKTKKMNLLGVIGHSVLKDFEIFIDLYLNQITLTRVDKLGNRLDDNVYLEEITDSINFKLKKHTIVLNTEVNGVMLKMGLDSAAEYNQLNKKVSSKVLKNFFPSRKLKLSGASGKTVEVMAGKLFRVKLSDNVYFGPMQTVLANLKRMNEAFGTRLDGVLGYEFFKQKRTIINYKKRQLYFVKTPMPRQ